MPSREPPTCADCGAPTHPLIAWGDDLDLCASCYTARLLEVEVGNALAAAREVIRWHHHTLNGYAVPPIGIGGRWI